MLKDRPQQDREDRKLSLLLSWRLNVSLMGKKTQDDRDVFSVSVVLGVPF